MRLIKKISADPSQSLNVVMDDNTIMLLNLYFSDTQKGWFIKSLEHPRLTLNGKRITTNLNMLSQFYNVLGFGLACLTKDGREPILQSDFVRGFASLYILDSNDVDFVKNYGGTL